MASLELKRTQARITKNEWTSFIIAHRYISEHRRLGNINIDDSPRKVLQDLFGIGDTTAGRIITLSNDMNLPDESKKLGRPRKVLSDEYVNEIRNFTVECTKTGQPATAKRIRTHLEDQGFDVPSLSVMKEDLKLAGLHYGMGKRQNILHDSEAIVNYRKTYLERRLSNLNCNELPIQPEVFLDESYCHLDHHARRTYYVPDTVVNQTGRKPMLVMFGAFAVYKENNCLRAELVEENTIIWPVKGKAHVQEEENVGMKRKRGRPPTKNTAQAFANLPQCVKDANIAPDYHDYHGNFNAGLFEKLFERLCEKLSERFPSGCIIHMDGAKYHFRKVDPLPNSNARVQDICDWFSQSQYPMPPSPKPGKLPSKKVLLEHLKEIRSERPVVYAVHEIASKYGHTVMKTPPYHCELQPIEGLWGIVKQQIAYNPEPANTTEVQFAHRLYRLFAAVHSTDLLSLWRKTVNQCKYYNDEHQRNAVHSVAVEEDGGSLES